MLVGDGGTRWWNALCTAEQKQICESLIPSWLVIGHADETLVEATVAPIVR